MRYSVLVGKTGRTVGVITTCMEIVIHLVMMMSSVLAKTLLIISDYFSQFFTALRSRLFNILSAASKSF